MSKMNMSKMEDYQQPTHIVICRDKELALWPFGRPLPNGWRHQGTVGSRRHCLEAVGQMLPQDAAAEVCVSTWSRRYH